MGPAGVHASYGLGRIWVEFMRLIDMFGITRLALAVVVSTAPKENRFCVLVPYVHEATLSKVCCNGVSERNVMEVTNEWKHTVRQCGTV